MKRIVTATKYVSIKQRDGEMGLTPNIPLHVREGAVVKAAAYRQRANVMTICIW